MKLNGTLILTLVVALAAITGIAWTQNMDRAVCPLTGETPVCIGDGPGPHGLMGPHHQPQRMAAALDLTAEQREAMREIMNAERAANRERMETALDGILTAEQLVQLEEIKARYGTRGGKNQLGRMGRMGRRAPMGGGPADRPARRLEQMTANLNLTAAQQDEIRLILEEAAPGPGIETRDKVRAVLTPDQQAQMDQQCQQRTPGMGQGTRPGMGYGAGPGEMYGRKGRGMGRNPHARGPAGQGVGLPDHLVWQLQLTDEQSEAVRQLMTEIRSEQRSQTRNQIEALLTPGQQDKLDQLHQN